MKPYIRSTLVLLLAVMCLGGFSACSKVPAGNVGVLVDLYGSSKGVEEKPLGVGRYYVGFNQELYLFPTSQQNYTWTKSTGEGKAQNEEIEFQNKDGMNISADFGISYSINPDKVSILFQKYRRSVEEITDTYLRNMVRDSLNTHASTMPVEEIYGEGKADLMKKINADMKEWNAPLGINVDRVYLIGHFRLPPAVETALNAKIAATQMAQQRENEVAQATAEGQKEVAKAKAQATANELLAKSLSPELVAYQTMMLQREYIEKWDGKQSQVSITGNSGVVPTFSVPAPSLVPKQQ